MNKKIFLRRLGKHIAKICREKGFSQDRLYLEAGFSRGTMSKIENGRVDVKIYTLLKISETIDVPLPSLVEFKKPRKR